MFACQCYVQEGDQRDAASQRGEQHPVPVSCRAHRVAMKTMANSEAIAVRAPKDLHGSEAVPPEKLDPGDDDRGASNHRVERVEGLLLAEPRDPFDQELQVGLNGTEIDVSGLRRGISG
jgi:hypothetical protein